jgi:sec-independent protein translocase protein TatB
MGSLGTGEILVIAIVALIVFGPERLPELARKAGEMLAKAREATNSVTSALDSEYDGITAPLQDLKKEYDTTVKGFKDAASTATGFSVDLTSAPSKKPTKPAATEPSDEPALLETETETDAETEIDAEIEINDDASSSSTTPRDTGNSPDSDS